MKMQSRDCADSKSIQVCGGTLVTDSASVASKHEEVEVTDQVQLGNAFKPLMIQYDTAGLYEVILDSIEQIC